MDKLIGLWNIIYDSLIEPHFYVILSWVLLGAISQVIYIWRNDEDVVA